MKTTAEIEKESSHIKEKIFYLGVTKHTPTLQLTQLLF